MKQSYKTVLILLILFPVLFLPACVVESVSDKLNDIDTLSESDPKSAITALSEIRPSELNEKDRKYYDLLCIKVDDKNYKRHSSDSLITGVLEYFKEHPDEEKCAEILYYAGRVYSDIRDYPTALRYFEEALDTLPLDSKINKLRSSILIQTAQLYNKLRLYEPAIQYIRESLQLDSLRQDTFNIMSNLELLGHVYTYHRQFKSADSAYREAIKIAQMEYPQNSAREKMYLAGLKRREEKYDSALVLIRGIPETVPKDLRPTALGYAAGIYFHAGIPDTAAMYARQLITLGDVPNLKNAYYYLSNPRLRDYVPKDSISSYIDKYQYYTEEYMRTNSDRSALIQNSQYNYQNHVRDKLKALKTRDNWIITAAILAVLMLMAVIICLVLNIRNKRTLIKLLVSNQNVITLKNSLSERENALSKMNQEFDAAIAAALSPDITLLKKYNLNIEQIRNSILATCNEICSDPSQCIPVSQEILKSNAYTELRKKVKEKETITDSDNLWIELRDCISNAYPQFFDKLNLLAGEDLKVDQINLLLLLKCGLKPSEIEKVLALGSSGITSSRKRLSVKLFGVKIEPAVFDRLIRML